MPGLGHKSYIQIGEETTYGTAVVATKKLEVVSMDVSPVVGMIPDPSLHDKQSRRALYQGGLLFRGRFVVRCNYDGLLNLLRGVFGTYASAVVETGVIDHTFTEGQSLKSFTIQMIEGDVPTTKCQRLVGAKLTGLTIRGTAGQGADAMLQVEFTVLAKDKTANETPTASLSFPSTLPVLYHQAITVEDGTADAAASIRVRAFEVSLENPHAEDRFYLTSVNVDEPLRSDFIVARWRLTQEFTTVTQFNAARSFTAATPRLRLIFQHPTTIGVASKREFELRSNKAQLAEFSSPVEGYGILISTATWEAFHDTTDVSALALRVRNTEVALT